MTADGVVPADQTAAPQTTALISRARLIDQPFWLATVFACLSPPRYSVLPLKSSCATTSWSAETRARAPRARVVQAYVCA